MCVVVNTTSGIRAASSATRLTSTTSEMLPPQWQTNTPTRGACTPGVDPLAAESVASNMVGSPRGRARVHTHGAPWLITVAVSGEHAQAARRLRAESGDPIKEPVSYTHLRAHETRHD